MRARSRETVVSAAVIVLFGCGSPGNTERDAGPDLLWLTDGLPPIEAVRPPALTPCPEGWREVAHDSEGIVSCDPYPETGVLDCPYGEAHFPGEPGCAPAGAPCPADLWADGLSDDGSVVFVAEWAPAGGDGTRARPFARIGDALAVATDGVTVALTSGTYEEALDIPPGVTVRGACATGTLIHAFVGDPASAVVLVTGPGAVLRDVTVGNSTKAGIAVTGADAALRLEGVMVQAARAAGIFVDLAATLTGQGIIVRRTAPDGDGLTGWGLDVAGGGRATLSRVVFEENRDMAVVVSQAGSRVELTDVAIRQTQGQMSDGDRGWGLTVAEGATAGLTRAYLSDNHETAVVARDSGSSLRLTDVVIRDTLPDASGQGGKGVWVAAGAHAEITRLRVSGSAHVGVTAHEGATLTLSDAVILDTQPQASPPAPGRGLVVQQGATAELFRIILARSHGVGLFVAGPTAGAEIQDVVVLDTLSFGTRGAGIAVGFGAVASGARVRVERSPELGIYVDGTGSRLEVRDLIVRDMGGRPDGHLGRALNVQRGGTAELERVLLERAREVGIFASGEASVWATDIVIQDTLARACVSSSCPDVPAGFGVYAGDGASLRFERFRFSRANLCGLHIGPAGLVDLLTGVVATNPIGVCLQVPGYDVERLTNEVAYVDNDTQLEAVDFGTLESTTPLEL